MTVGRCVLLEQIGRGGMGEVWKANDPVVGAEVVVKLLPPDLAANPTEILRLKESFVRVMDVPHQHICPVYQFDTDPKIGPFVVMKYIPGIPLSLYRLRYVKAHGRFPISEVVRLLRPIAIALDYAHAKGVIHRDIKPENILVREDGSDPQLVDFGLAAEIQRSVVRVSQVRFDSSGTLAYMAPEQWRGRQQDGATDQYALTAVAYELLTGHPPFDLPDAQLLRQCVLNDDPPELPGDRNLSAALACGLAKAATDRYPNCVAMLDAIADPPPALVVPPRPSSPPPLPAASARSNWLLPAVTAVALVGMGGVYYLRQPPAAPSGTNPPANNNATAANTPPPQGTPPVTTPAPVPPPTVPPPNVTPVVNPNPTPPAPVIPQVTVLTATEKEEVMKGLDADLERLAVPVKAWRDQLTALDQPNDAASTDVYKRLLATRDSLAAFATKYTETNTALKASPLVEPKDVPALKKRIEDAAALKIGGRSADEWLKAATDDHPAYVKMQVESKEARKRELAVFTDTLRKTGKELLIAAEAADTRGFDVAFASSKEFQKTLIERRKLVRDTLDALTRIEREVTATLPPDPKRLAELQTTFAALTVPDAAWCDETRMLAQKVETEVKAARTGFYTRQKKLGEAHLEAQWFVCTTNEGTPIFYTGPQRQELTYEGRTPFVDDDKNRKIEFGYGANNIHRNSNSTYTLIPVPYFDEQKQLKSVNVDGNQNTDRIAYKYRVLLQDSWKFAYDAGRERQKYVPYNERDSDTVKKKETEMVKALTAKLNEVFPGLQLAEKEVFVTWKRVKDGSEKEVTFENMFEGGFRTGVLVPKEPPAGLTGQGDDEYRTVISEAKRLATGVAPDVVKKSPIVTGAVWKGTIDSGGYLIDVKVTFTEVTGNTIRGTIVSTTANRSGELQFLGSFTGTDITFLTKRTGNNNGYLYGGSEYTGRVNGDIASGRWNGESNYSGTFKFSRE